LYYYFAHGWGYILPRSKSVGFEANLKDTQKNKLYNLDPDHIIFNSQTSWFGMVKKEVNFDYKPYGFANINYKDVIPFIDVRQNSEKPHIGVSRLLSLRTQIENYYLAMQGKSNLIKRSGNILVSLDATKVDDLGLDSSIGTGQFDKDGNPVTTTHKEKLEQQIRETSLGNNSMGIMFSTLPLKSMPLSQGLENVKFGESDIGLWGKAANLGEGEPIDNLRKCGTQTTGYQN
jgi:hypothetical protein